MELTSSLSRLPTLMDNADDDEETEEQKEETRKYMEEFKRRQEAAKTNPFIQKQKELVRKFANFKRVFRERHPNDEIEAMAEYIIKNREFMADLKEVSEAMKKAKK
jgi:hypothetical protein